MSEKKPSKKQKYSTPKLVRYGDFKKVTLGTRQRQNDTMNTAQTNKTRSSTG